MMDAFHSLPPATVGELLVEDGMTEPVVHIPPDTSLQAAYKLMYASCIRHLPVVDCHQLVGLISLGDITRAGPYAVESHLLAYQDYGLDALTVAQVMTHPVITITPEISLRDAAQIMLEYKIGSLPVVGETGDLIGMITETDILRLMTASDD